MPTDLLRVFVIGIAGRMLDSMNHKMKSTSQQFKFGQSNVQEQHEDPLELANFVTNSLCKIFLSFDDPHY